MIDLISQHYNGNIILNPALAGDDLKRARESFPEKLCQILEQSNGIRTNVEESVSWIIYPYEKIVEETEFYNSNYFLEGAIFSANGAGEAYYIDNDGYVYRFDVTDNADVVVANSIEEFFRD